MYTASMALLESLREAGVTHVFANFGSDHPAIVEAIAEATATGRPIPQIITCPNEMVALSCAHGFTQVTGKAQAVLVHVDCGTQALAGAIHNAARGRIPVFIFAGMSPVTQEGELRGSRNEFIHWVQDVRDQRGIVRQYVKYDNEIRSGVNVRQIVRRAVQIASSDPQGPVYVVAAREVLEAESSQANEGKWSPIDPAALESGTVRTIVDRLAGAHRPLVVTSYLGRNPAAVSELVRFCGRLGIGVVESAPGFMNYPHSDPLYLGNYWNQPFQNAALAEADAILLLDSDIPWVPTVNRPAAGADIFHIDVDPLKEAMPLWYIRAAGSYRADAATALRQMNAYLDTAGIDPDVIGSRRRHYARRHAERATKLLALEKPAQGVITAEMAVAAVRDQIGESGIVLSESITNYHAVHDHLGRTAPGSIFTSGGSSLGWHGGAAIGAKLAAPEKTVVAITGDGSFMFSVPSTVHWMARRYRTPFLQVVLNNGGWKAPKFSALAVHPDGYASRAADIGVSFAPAPDYAGIAAAAGGAFGRKVERPGDLEGAVADALAAVREEGRAAVLDVVLGQL